MSRAHYNFFLTLTQIMSARLLFAHNLKRHRMQKMLSQEGLAELCDLHRTYISAVERGVKNISIDNMEKLAGALAVDIRELLVPYDYSEK